MSTSTAKDKPSIPQRADIAQKDTWNLSDIFESDDIWEAEFTLVTAEMEQAREFAGHLAESPEQLYDCLKLRNQLSSRLFNLYHYSHLAKDIDNRVSKYQEMNERAAVLSSKMSAKFSFIEPELLTIDEAKLREMAGKFKVVDEFDFYISELIRSKEHIRSEEVEELLANSAMVARGPSNIFSMLDDADITYPSIEDENGVTVQMTKQRYSKYMESNDRRVRADAYTQFMQPYKQFRNTIAASLGTSVQADVFYSRARNFESCLHGELDGDNIPTSVYHALLDTTENKISGLHKYNNLRMKILGLKELHPYDLNAPLIPDEKFEINYADAVKGTIEAVAPLGTKYEDDLKKAFDARWVDVYESEGKGSGAYSYGNHNIHPYVLMNYNNTLDSMFTLAHEMGHAMHSFLTSQVQPFSKAHYSTFVAEVASTLNEGLLLNLLLKQSDSDQRKMYLINRYLDNTVGTFYRQVMYARFEFMIHDAVEKGGALSPDWMSLAWGELTAKYYGPDVIVGELEPLKWSRIPHFYNTYYVYQYATSYAASQAILEKFMAGEEGIVDKYLELLSSGGNAHPIEQLAKCGVDMTTAKPFENTIALFDSRVDELAKLAGV